MIKLGSIDDWKPRPGIVTTWNATPAAKAAAMRAPVDPTPPSYQQRNSITATLQRAAATVVGAAPDRHSQVCVVAWDFPGDCDIPAMTATLNGYIRRHDTLSSWFEVKQNAPVLRRTMTDPNEIEVAPATYGRIGSSTELRDHIDRTTPHLFAWDTWSYGVIQREDHFTFYVCADHMNADALSAPVTFLDIQQLYAAETGGYPASLPPAGSYLSFCAEEHAYSSSLAEDSPEVAHWLRFLAENNGDLPHFPLPLGVESGASACRIEVVPLMDAEQSERFEAACRAEGARFTGGVLAGSALVEEAINGAQTHYMLTPGSGRCTPEEFMTVGWMASLVPVTVPLNRGAGFFELAREAQRSFDAGTRLGKVSVHRALDLVTPEMGVVAKPAWSAPMVSYVDARKVRFGEVFDQVNFCFFGYSRLIDEVFLWINRFDSGTSMTVMHPDNPTATESVRQYVKVLTDVFAQAVHPDQLMHTG